MLERLTDLPPDVIGLKAVGTVSEEDYERVLLPLLEEARRAGHRVKFLYEIGPEFDRLTAGAAWADARTGFRYMRLVDGCAILTDIGWMRKSVQLVDFFIPCPVRVYDPEERAEAIEWLESLPLGTGISHRLIPETGVIVIEIDKPLRARDFDALSATVDAWIESHGSLSGLVVRASEFPGWDNLEGLLAHVRFVREHHRKVHRVALAVESKLTNLVAGIAKIFVEAEVRQFGYDELDRAVAWAGEPADRERVPGHPHQVAAPQQR